MTLDKIKTLDKDDILNLLGLETKPKPLDYLVPALTLFGVGMLVGAGVGLLVAPRSGREPMAKLPQRASDAAHRVSEQISEKLEDHKANA